jgi:hypothetical protein
MGVLIGRGEGGATPGRRGTQSIMLVTTSPNPNPKSCVPTLFGRQLAGSSSAVQVTSTRPVQSVPRRQAAPVAPVIFLALRSHLGSHEGQDSVSQPNRHCFFLKKHLVCIAAMAACMLGIAL